MSRVSTVSLLLLFFALFGMFAAGRSLAQPAPIIFVPNLGQLADQFGRPMPEVRFTAQSSGVKCYFTNSSMHYVFSQLVRVSGFSGVRAALRDRSHDSLMLYRVDAHFIGANPNAEIEAADTTEDYTNYYLPSCPNGITHVPGFQRIVYKELYPHIDLVLYTPSGDDATRQAGLEYDFIVHPGGDPNQIQIAYDHASSLQTNEDGGFRLTSPFGEVTETKPMGYQLVRSNERQAVSAEFRLTNDTLRFAVGAYDRSRDLTIDPQRIWGTYYCGSNDTNTTLVNDLAVDHIGSVDIVGSTNALANIASSGAFQTTFGGGFRDAFVAKFNSAGTLLWSTYYGGGSEDDGNALACDGVDGILVAGSTESSSGITSSGAFQTTFTGSQDAMLLSFDSTGVRRWATYYSGNGITPPDPVKGHTGPSNTVGTGVSVDSLGNILFIGSTMSTSGIATTGAYKTSLSTGSTLTFDLFLAKFSSAGARQWATYFGGPGDENSGWVETDANNNIYFCSSTSSASGVATSGAFQTTSGPSCLAKFSPTGSISWATYYLKDANASLARIAVSRSGNIYFAGYDSSTSASIATPGAFQTTTSGATDGVFGKFNPSGNRIWASYYGGPGDDWLFAIAVDTSENLFAGGMTWSSSGIAANGEYQTSLIGPYDPFFFKFDSSGHKRFWATYYGQRGYVYGIGLDRAGHPFVGGSTNVTGPNYIFSTSGAYEPLPTNYTNGFVSKFCDPAMVHITSTASGTVCANTPVTLSTATGALTYQWYVNGTTITGATGSSYTFTTPQGGGTYIYTAGVEGTDLCNATSDTVRLHIRPGVQVDIPPVNEICPGSSVKFLATTSPGAVSYSWTPVGTLDHPDSLQPTASPTKPTTYTLSVTDTSGCITTKQITVTLYAGPKVAAGGNHTVCGGTPVTLSATGSGGVAPYTYSWSPTTGLDRIDSNVVIAAPDTTTKYYVTITDHNGCTSRDSSAVTVNPLLKLSAGPELSICNGSSIKIATLLAGGKTPYTIKWTPATGLSSTTIAQPIASPSTTTRYTIMVTDKNGCTAADSVLITVADTLTPRISADGPLTLCAGDSLRLNAPTGYASYKWSNGATLSSIPIIASGTYYVRVTDSAGCGGTSQKVNVTVFPDSVPRPVISTPSTAICAGDSVKVTTTVPYASYQWSTGDTTGAIYVSKNGLYSVTVSNASGCTGSTAPLQFTVVPRPTVNITPNGAATLCDGDTLVLSATAGYQYAWTKDGNPFDSVQTIRVTQGGSYAVTATNSTGCTASSGPVVVTLAAMPQPSIAGPSSLCANGIGHYHVTPAVGTFDWQIVPAALGSTLAQAGDSIVIQWGATGSGTLTVIDTNSDGCVGTAQVSIAIGDHLTPTIAPPGPIALCPGDSATLDAGTGYASYQWSLNGSQLTGETSHRLRVGSSGGYSVFVTDATGCNGNSQPVSVTLYPAPATPVITANGTTLTSSPAAHYQWELNGVPLPGDTMQTVAFDSTGAYTVTITDANGCSVASAPMGSVPTVVATFPPLTTASPTQTITIPLYLTNTAQLDASNATSYAGILRVDAGLLTPLNAAAVRNGTDWTLPINGPWTKGMDTLMELKFIAGTIDPDCGPLSLDTFYFSNAPLKVERVHGTVCVSGPCSPWLTSSDTALAIKRVEPNPSTGSFSVRYHTTEDGPVELALQDVLGRTVKYLVNESRTAGSFEETYSTTDLPVGLYRLTLQNGARNKSVLVEFEK